MDCIIGKSLQMEENSRNIIESKENRIKVYKKQLVQLHNNLLLCSFETVIRVWKLPNLQTPRIFNNQNAIIKSIIQLRNKTIATGIKDGIIRIWDHDSLDIISLLKGHTKSVLCLLESEYNGNMISGSSDCSVRIWDISSQQCLTTLQSYDSSVTCLLELRDSRLVTGSLSKHIVIWNQKFNRPSRILTNSEKIYSLIQLTNEIIAFGSDKGVQIFNINAKKFIKTIKHILSEKIPIIKIDFKTIISCNKEKIYVIDVLSDKILCKYQDPYENSIINMVLLSDNLFVYMTSTPQVNLLKLSKYSLKKNTSIDCKMCISV